MKNNIIPGNQPLKSEAKGRVTVFAGSQKMTIEPCPTCNKMVYTEHGQAIEVNLISLRAFVQDGSAKYWHCTTCGVKITISEGK